MRYGFIDSLRAIAVLSVIAMHWIQNFHKISENGDGYVNILRYIDLGRFGVVIFFLVSGFVIVKSFSSFKAFWIKRFFRLYPAFWLSVLLAYPVMKWWGLKIGWDDLLYNMTMLPQFFGSPMILWLYWTLEVELVFYLLMSVLFLMGWLEDPKKIFYVFLCCIGLFVMGRLTNFHSTHVGLAEMPHFLAIMFMGSVARMVYDGKKEAKRYLFWMIGIVVALQTLAIVKYLLTQKFQYIPVMAGFLSAELVFALFVLFRIEAKILILIGIVSYSLYLFHPIVLHGIYLIFTRVLHTRLDHIESYFLINAVLLFPLAYGVYRYVERPLNRLGHKIAVRV